MNEERREELTRLYDMLARYHWLGRHLRGAGPAEGLELHKRLDPPQSGEPLAGPGEGTSALHDWLWDRITSDRRAPESPAVLDVGCGFGATLLSWAQRHESGRFVGLTLSGYQVARATETAAKLGLGDRCTFRVQSYDEKVEGKYDLIVAVESLFHAPRIDRTIGHLARSLAPGGRLLLLEDMARNAKVAEEKDAEVLLHCWRTAQLHDRAGYERALDAAELDVQMEIDLTARVHRRTPSELARSRRRLTWTKRLVPFPLVREVADAFLGGLALERLYANDHMTYRAIVAQQRSA